MENIISHWRNFNDDIKPFIHPKDKKYINENNHYTFENYDEAIEHEDFDDFKNKIHFGLLPVPYSGDILNAKIYILLLNPGYSILNYHEETKSCSNLKKDLIKNILQDFSDEEEYPLLWLNPEYLWTAGGQWVENKFRPLLNHVLKTKKENNKNFKYIDALKLVSKKVALLELVPYHSKSKVKKNVLGIKSVEIMREFVKTTLIDKAIKNEACIIQTRSINEWGLNLESYKKKDKYKNIIVYDRGQRRSASLYKNPQAWDKLTEFIFN